MLGLRGKSSSTQEMEDAGIKLKTIRLTKNGTPHESMSFPAFDFTELLNKTWDESDIREDFVDWKLMFFIFKDDDNGVCHVRPHGRVAADVFELPVPDKLTGRTTYTKQCFWFNKLYIKNILELL